MQQIHVNLNSRTNKDREAIFIYECSARSDRDQRVRIQDFLKFIPDS